MADHRLPLLRGKITKVDPYEATTRGGVRPAIPTPDPAAHRARLLTQLDEIERQVALRPVGTRDELAAREIVAVRPAAGAELTADQLDDAKTDVRLIGVVPETGTVLLDVGNAHLDSLRAKLNAFADDALVVTTVKEDGSSTIHRESERAVAPVELIALAELDDQRGTRLRTEAALAADRAYWFEVACRGGYRRPLVETEASRTQVARQLQRADAPQKLDEFVGPEQVYFFVKVTLAQLESLRAATDCRRWLQRHVARHRRGKPDEDRRPRLRARRAPIPVTTKRQTKYSRFMPNRSRRARIAGPPSGAAGAGGHHRRGREEDLRGPDRRRGGRSASGSSRGGRDGP